MAPDITTKTKIYFGDTEMTEIKELTAPPILDDLIDPGIAATINDHDPRDFGPIDEMNELPSGKLHLQAIQAMIKKEFHVPAFIDLDAITEPATFTYKPAPKPKTYLTTYNPYMSKDWASTFEKLVKDYRDNFDVNSLYPAYFVPARGSQKTDPITKALIQRAAYEDAMDAMHYGYRAHTAFIDETAYPDYYYAIPPRCGKSLIAARMAGGDFDGDTLAVIPVDDVKKKEESMNIVIYRSTLQRAMEVSHYFEERLKEHPYGQNVAMTCGGLRFSGVTNALRIWICYGGCDKMAGLEPDYYSADSVASELYLIQRASRRGGASNHGLYELWNIIRKYLTEYYTKDAVDEIESRMLDLREKKTGWDLGLFSPADWVWEISEDIHSLLSHRYEDLVKIRPITDPAKLFGIDVRVTKFAHNYIKLIRKVKKEEDMETQKIVEMNEEKVAQVARNHSGKLYMQYNAAKLALECVIVDDRGIAVGFEIKCDRVLNYDDMALLDREIDRRFKTERHYRSLSESRPFVRTKVSAYSLPEIDQVIFNEPATIVYWKDGTKTIVQARGEKFDPEKGLAMAVSKKAMGNKREYYHPFLHWVRKFKKQNQFAKED